MWPSKLRWLHYPRSLDGVFVSASPQISMDSQQDKLLTISSMTQPRTSERYCQSWPSSPPISTTQAPCPAPQTCSTTFILHQRIQQPPQVHIVFFIHRISVYLPHHPPLAFAFSHSFPCSHRLHYLTTPGSLPCMDLCFANYFLGFSLRNLKFGGISLLGVVLSFRIN